MTESLSPKNTMRLAVQWAPPETAGKINWEKLLPDDRNTFF